ncbi:MAG: hypothetical protein Q4C87_08055 [Actinomycetaceae bacterium]|nr:hypothetical protein [Actinomycetaceae bacterium]
MEIFSAHYHIEEKEIRPDGVDFLLRTQTTQHVYAFFIVPNEKEPYTLGLSAKIPDSLPVIRIIATPHPHQVCINVCGSVYLGNVNRPDSFVYCPQSNGHAHHWYAYPEEGILVFSTRNSLFAIDQDGVRWETGKMPGCCVELQGHKSGILYGIYDLHGRDEYFSVDIDSGRVNTAPVPFE